MPRDVGYGHEQKPDIPTPHSTSQFANPYAVNQGVGPSQPYAHYGTQPAVASYSSYSRYSIDDGLDAAGDRPPPLKRGDACLYCRKRRIRCSATKPSCHHCTKLRRECVYDVGKPISRVRRLENKVAELESYLQAAEAAAAEANGRAAHAHAQVRAAQAQRATPPQAPMGHQLMPGVGHDMLNGLNRPLNVAGASYLQYNTVSSVPSHTVQPQGSQTGGRGPEEPSPPPPMSAQQSTAYAYPPGTLDQSTVDITMLDNFQPAPGMRTMAPRVGQMVPIYAPPQPVHVPPVPGPMSQAMPSSGPQPPQPPPQPHPQQPRATNFDWDALDPDFMSMVNQMGETSTSTPGQGQQDQQQRFQQPQYQFSYPSVRPDQQHSVPQAQAQAHRPSPPQPPRGPPQYPHFGATESAILNQGISASQNIQLPGSASDITGRVSGAFIEDTDDELDTTGTSSLPSEWTKYDLVGGWYDPNDLPREARAELLGHFFSNKKTRLSRGYHVPRFMAALDQAPSKRPHPCLVYAMYAIVARFSPAPKLKRLDDHFYQTASAQLTNAVKAVDRPFDAARAATILAVYNYSNAFYQAATMMLAQSARLAFSCGLHQIPSSVFQPSRIPRDPNRGRLLGVMRSRAWLLFPPQDSIELGERIWAFWNIYIVDRTGAIGSQQPPSIPDYEVCTPFPKPLYEYELGLTSHRDDYSLSSLDDDVNPPQELPHDSDASAAILYIKSLALLERASKLMYLPVERNSPAYDHLTPSSAASEISPAQQYDMSAGPSHGNGSTGTPDLSSVSPSSDIDDYLNYQNYAADNMSARQFALSVSGKGKSRMRCARLRTPKAYEQVRVALLRLEADLPPDHRTPWGTWNGTGEAWIYNNPSKESVTVNFLRGCAWMFLFDVYSYQAENHEAVAVARRLAHSIRLLFPQQLAADLDVFISIVWFFISNILIREVKRLQALGDTASAADVEADFNVVVEALKLYGKRHDIASIQAKRAETMREATLDDMEFMKGDGYDGDYRGQIFVDGKTVH